MVRKSIPHGILQKLEMQLQLQLPARVWLKKSIAFNTIIFYTTINEFNAQLMREIFRVQFYEIDR